jgi:hypothetical protein
MPTQVSALQQIGHEKQCSYDWSIGASNKGTLITTYTIVLRLVVPVSTSGLTIVDTRRRRISK